MPTYGRSGNITIKVPEGRPEEAAEILQYLEQEIIAGGIPRETIRAERKNGDQMFVAEAIMIVDWGLMAIDWGSKAATLFQAINWASERWGRAISLTNSAGEEVRIGSGEGSISAEEGARRIGLELGAQAGPITSKPSTLGVVLLGASEFPYMQNLDNPAFKRSAQLFKSLFDPPNLTFRSTVILDLFDQDMPPHELTQSIMDFIDKNSLTMKDIIFYYCGHGAYLPGQVFYLTIKTTRNAQKATTGLKPYDLRQDLDSRLIDKRVYLIFDCCFASAASESFMADHTDEAFRERVAEGFPAYGTALLSAAPRDMAALSPVGEEFTMFTGALADVIRNGAPGQDQRLSLNGLREAVRRRIFEKFGIGAVYPELHTPRQKAGDISTLPLFLNKAPKTEQKRTTPELDLREPSDVKAAINTVSQHLRSESVVFRKTAIAELARLYSITLNEGLRTHIKGLIEEAEDDDSRSVQEQAKKYLLQISQLEKRSAIHEAKPWKNRDALTIKHERLIQAFTGYSKAVTAVAFSPQSHLILSGASDGTIKIWHAEGNWQKPYLENNRGGLNLHVGQVNSVAFSPDGKTIAAGGTGRLLARLRVADIAADKKSKSYSISRGPIARRLVFIILFLSIEGIPLSILWLISLLFRNNMNVTGICFSRDGKFLLSAYNRKGFYLWDIATREKIRKFGRPFSIFKRRWPRLLEGPTSCVAYSPDGRFALSGTLDGTITLWSIGTGEALGTLGRHFGTVNSVDFSKDSKLAISGSDDKTLKLWDMSSRREIVGYTGHDGGVTSVAFSPDSRYVLSGGMDGTLKFWETNTGQEMLTIAAHSFSVRSVAISPNGRFALSGGDDKTLRLWDLSGL